MPLRSTVGTIAVTTTRKQLCNSTAPIRYGVRLRADSTTAKVYFGGSTVTATTGYMINNSGDQIAAGEFDKLEDIYLIGDSSVTVHVDIVMQEGLTITP